MAQNQQAPAEKKLWQICLTFGLSLGVSIYVLGPWAGSWLDKRLDTAPIFLISGVLLAIAACFYRLFRELRLLDRQEKNREK